MFDLNSCALARDELNLTSSILHQTFVDLSKSIASSLIPTYRAFENAHLRLRFVLRSFVSSVCRPAPAGRVNRKVKDQAERVISISQLNTLLHLHRRPINVVVYHDPSGRTHLGIGLALRCFQRLSFPNIATQHCR